MRDPARIEKVLTVLRAIWERNPDLRLGQLIGNIIADSSPTLYYMEDDILVKALEEMYGIHISEVDEYLKEKEITEPEDMTFKEMLDKDLLEYLNNKEEK